MFLGVTTAMGELQQLDTTLTIWSLSMFPQWPLKVLQPKTPYGPKSIFPIRLQSSLFTMHVMYFLFVKNFKLLHKYEKGTPVKRRTGRPLT